MAYGKDYKKPYKKKESAPKVEYKPKRGKLAPLMKEEENCQGGQVSGVRKLIPQRIVYS